MIIKRLKKKDTDLLNANDRIHSLEDELRGIASKMAKLENDHHKVIQELNVSHFYKFNTWSYSIAIQIELKFVGSTPRGSESTR